MTKGFVARASVTINSSIDRVWEALINPTTIKKYMFGSDVSSDWRVGSVITWKGLWQGKPYEDKGTILKIEKKKILQYTHFSPLMGKPDVPENYRTVTIELADLRDKTIVSLTQDNNPNQEFRKYSEKNWQTMLDTMKKVLER